MSAGLALAAFYGVFAIRLRANQIVAGNGYQHARVGLDAVPLQDPLRRDGFNARNPFEGKFQSVRLLKLGSRAALLPLD